jgi:hypothetical protein
MKKKLLVVLITVASTMMPNLASALTIDIGGLDLCEIKSLGYCLVSKDGWVIGNISD